MTDDTAPLREGSIAEMQGRYTDAIGHYLRAIEAARARDTPGPLCEALGYLGNLYQQQGQFDLARARLREGLEVAREHELEAHTSRLLGALGSVACSMGEDASARRLLEESLERSGALGSTLSHGASLSCMGVLAQRRGEPEEATACFERSIQIAREAGDRVVEGMWLGAWGSALLEHGGEDALAQAHEKLEAALESARHLGDPYLLASRHAALARAAHRRGDEQAAQEHSEAALAQLEGLGLTTRSSVIEDLARVAPQRLEQASIAVFAEQE